MKRPRSSLFVAGIVAVAAAPGLLRLEFDNAPERFFVQGDRSEAVLVDGPTWPRPDVRFLVTGPRLWSPEGLRWIIEFESALLDVDGVQTVVGPGTGLSTLDIDLETAVRQPASARERLLAEPMSDRLGWVSPAGEAVVVTALSDPDIDPESQIRLFESRLSSLPEDVTAHAWGLPVLDRAMAQATLGSFAVLIPLSALAVFLVLATCLSSWVTPLPPLLAVVWVEVVTWGSFGYARGSMDVIESMAAPLLLVITAGTSVHVLVDFRRRVREGRAPTEAAGGAVGDRRWGIVWGSASTAAAFGSLVLSPVRPLASLGLWAAGGIGLMIWFQLTAYRELLGLARWGVESPGSGPGRADMLDAHVRGLGERCAQWSIQRRGRVLSAFALTGVLALVFASKLTWRSDLPGYFDPDHPVRVSLAAFDEASVPTASVDITFERSDPDRSFITPADLEELAVLSDSLDALSADYRAYGAGDLFEAARRLVLVDDEADEEALWLALGLARLDPATDRAFDAVIQPTRAAITIALPLRAYPDGSIDVSEIEAAAQRLSPNLGASARAGGPYVSILKSQASLRRAMGISAFVTLFVVALCWLIGLRSPSLALRAMIPNVWPPLVVLALAAVTEIPFELPTVLTCSVLLGLSVDDTFHSFGYLRGKASGRALARAYGEFFTGHLVSTLTLAAGFLVFVASTLGPISDFGGLMAVGVTLALVGDLFLLPALLGRSGRTLAGKGPKPPPPAP